MDLLSLESNDKLINLERKEKKSFHNKTERIHKADTGKEVHEVISKVQKQKKLVSEWVVQICAIIKNNEFIGIRINKNMTTKTLVNCAHCEKMRFYGMRFDSCIQLSKHTILRGCEVDYLSAKQKTLYVNYRDLNG